MDRIDRRKREFDLTEGGLQYDAFGGKGLGPDERVSMGFLKIAKAIGADTVRKGMTSYYVEKARAASIAVGKSEDALTEKEAVNAGDVLVLGEDEYFRFEFDADDGYVNLVFFTPA